MYHVIKIQITVRKDYCGFCGRSNLKEFSQMLWEQHYSKCSCNGIPLASDGMLYKWYVKSSNGGGRNMLPPPLDQTNCFSFSLAMATPNRRHCWFFACEEQENWSFLLLLFFSGEILRYIMSALVLRAMEIFSSIVSRFPIVYSKKTLDSYGLTG